MKYCKTAALCALLVLGMGIQAYSEDLPEVSAEAYIVMETDTGDVLAAQKADEPMLIASTTKIMTALVVLDRCDLDMTVTVQPEWTGIEGSSMYLVPGQELTVRELLYGLMLASGNDAAVALACVTAGGVEAFAELMNEKAAALGCANTHFSNPNGLDAEDHYSSARDLALITREAIRNEEFCRIVSTASQTVGDQTYTNHNRLLTECEGVFGVKTGYTEAAGRTLVTCCERGGVTLICVTLDDPDDWDDHSALYAWAYDLYEGTEVLSADAQWTVPVIGGVCDEVTVSPEAALSVMLRDDQTAELSVRLPAFSYAQVDAGEQAGEAIIRVDGQAVRSVKLVYNDTVEREQEVKPAFFERIRAIFGNGERGIYTLE